MVVICCSHAIVSSSVGPEYYVTIMSFVDKTQIEPGCTVLMNHKVLLHINSPTNSKTAFS